MTKFYDDKKIATISLTDDRYGYRSGPDWENDFFEVGRLEYNEELDAYKVDDVDYLIDYAESYANGTNSDADYNYDDDGNVILPSCTALYEVEEI